MRDHDVSSLTAGELERARRELAASLALARPDSPARVAIRAYLNAIGTELATRTGGSIRAELSSGAAQHRACPGCRTAASRTAPDPSSRNGGGHMPGPNASTAPDTSTDVDIEEVRGPLEGTRILRLALDALEDKLPFAYTCDGLEAELWALREKIDAAEHAQIRAIGHREYLIIQPLTPDTPGPRITQATQAVRTLDDLGLVIRLV